MPAPIALTPIAWTALRVGAVAAVALYTARGRPTTPKDAHRERVLDDLPEGLAAGPHRAEAERALHGHGRLKRVVRWRGGPGLEIDLSALGRFRVRRVD